jgi:hypothetical protein
MISFSTTTTCLLSFLLLVPNGVAEEIRCSKHLFAFTPPVTWRVEYFDSKGMAINGPSDASEYQLKPDSKNKYTTIYISTIPYSAKTYTLAQIEKSLIQELSTNIVQKTIEEENLDGLLKETSTRRPEMDRLKKRFLITYEMTAIDKIELQCQSFAILGANRVTLVSGICPKHESDKFQSVLVGVADSFHFEAGQEYVEPNWTKSGQLWVVLGMVMIIIVIAVRHRINP